MAPARSSVSGIWSGRWEVSFGLSGKLRTDPSALVICHWRSVGGKDVVPSVSQTPISCAVASIWGLQRTWSIKKLTSKIKSTCWLSDLSRYIESWGWFIMNIISCWSCETNKLLRAGIICASKSLFHIRIRLNTVSSASHFGYESGTTQSPVSAHWTKLGGTFTRKRYLNWKYYGTGLPLRLRKDVVILLRANMGKMFALG